RVFTYLDGQGYNTSNMISTVGALMMALAVIILLINIIITVAKNEKVVRDPWRAELTVDWSLPLPVPHYNFAQIPLVRGLDAYWIEKKENGGKLMPAESLEDFHMPHSSIIPFILSFGLFVAGFGALHLASGKDWAIDAVADLPQ